MQLQNEMKSNPAVKEMYCPQEDHEKKSEMQGGGQIGRLITRILITIQVAFSTFH